MAARRQVREKNASSRSSSGPGMPMGQSRGARLREAAAEPVVRSFLEGPESLKRLAARELGGGTRWTAVGSPREEVGEAHSGGDGPGERRELSCFLYRELEGERGKGRYGERQPTPKLVRDRQAIGLSRKWPLVVPLEVLGSQRNSTTANGPSEYGSGHGALARLRTSTREVGLADLPVHTPAVLLGPSPIPSRFWETLSYGSVPSMVPGELQNASYCAGDNEWVVTTFPRALPGSRADVAALDRKLAAMLGEASGAGDVVQRAISTAAAYECGMEEMIRISATSNSQGAALLLKIWEGYREAVGCVVEDRCETLKMWQSAVMSTKSDYEERMMSLKKKSKERVDSLRSERDELKVEKSKLEARIRMLEARSAHQIGRAVTDRLSNVASYMNDLMDSVTTAHESLAHVVATEDIAAMDSSYRVPGGHTLAGFGTSMDKGGPMSDELKGRLAKEEGELIYRLKSSGKAASFICNKLELFASALAERRKEETAAAGAPSGPRRVSLEEAEMLLRSDDS